MDYGKIIKGVGGQTTLEIAMAIMIGIILIAGAVSVWNHFGKVKVERFDEYRDTRDLAIDPTNTLENQLTYSEPPLNIFSLLNSVGPLNLNPPSFPIEPTSPCFPDYNLTMNLSAELMLESAATAINLSDLFADSMNLKADFIAMSIWGRSSTNPWLGNYWYDNTLYVVANWLYPSDAGLMFDNDWDQVGVDFNNRVASFIGEACPFWIGGVNTDIQFDDNTYSCDPASSLWCYTSTDIWNNFITPGINIELQTEDLTYETIIKGELSSLLMKVAEANYNTCERSFLEANGMCDAECMVSFGCDATWGGVLTQAETEINNAITEVNSGQYMQAWASWQQAASLLDQYRDGFYACTGDTEWPWVLDECASITCEAEFEAWKARDRDAQIAAGLGLMGDADTISQEAATLKAAYRSCFNACSP